MLKNLIVNLVLGTKTDPAADYAVSMAQIFGAHLTGTALALKPVIPGMIIDGLGPDVIGAAINDNQKAARAAITQFETHAKMRGVTTTTMLVTEMLLDGVAHFASAARCFDLSVLLQDDPDKDTSQDLFIEAALFTSGRPVLIVPYIQNSPATFDRITCCWDGSERAARAISDAIPLLYRAKKIDILSVGSGKARDQITGVDIARHLARHGLKVDVQQIPGRDADVANIVLSHAADNGTDLLVMGGYGHSRWREFVLGGATRDILSAMTVPTLMSH